MGTLSQVAQNRKWVANAEFGQRSRRLTDLYDELTARLFPDLLAAGFARLDEVPAGFTDWTGENRIVFQKRDGLEWPTIEFELGKRGAVYCKVHLGVLPPECWSLAGVQVPQDEAPVWMSPVYMMLSRNSKGGPGCEEFGVRRSPFFETVVVERDIEALRRLLQMVFRHFREGFPAAWVNPRHHAVHRNLTMMWGPWNPGRVNRSIPAGDYYRTLI
jgi:hypothetical protein